ncbi:MAG: capsule assembly Wzi family protein [Pseudomonadota bacterium]
MPGTMLLPTIRKYLAPVLALLLVAIVSAQTAIAGPWLDPGDTALREDLELLSDAGVLSIPLTTWPISVSDVLGGMSGQRDPGVLSPSVQAAFNRIAARMQTESNWGFANVRSGLAVADGPRRVRLFEETPRANSQFHASAEYTGERFAARGKVTLAVNSPDDRSVWLDGTYLATILGNTSLSVGWEDRFWGPGWESALALSNNARPVPGIAVRRNHAKASTLPVLKWLGPWTARAFLGQLESGRAVPDARFVGMRVAFKPIPALEIGLTRTAQWGGEGRPDDLDSFFDLLIGRDNIGDDGITAETEPGNQMAGYDWRWRVKGGVRPIVFYGQLIGEDEAGGFPSRFLGQMGLSTSLPFGDSGASLHLYAEFSDTTCQFNESSKLFDCAYNNGLYPSGYRYRGRSLGHSTDADSRQVALGGSFRHKDGARSMVSVRFAELNRGGSELAPHSLTFAPADLLNVELSHERSLFNGRLSVGVGFDSAQSNANRLDGNDVRAFIQWGDRI